MKPHIAIRHMISLFVLVCLLILAAGSTDNGGDKSNSFTPKPQPAPKTQEELRQEKIDNQFSPWDGSHRNLTKLIKQSMNDPDSYKHVETVYWDKGDHLIVKTTFRGKNAFGGVVTNSVMAKVDLDGNVIEIVSQGP